jgi:hypothetical protein
VTPVIIDLLIVRITFKSVFQIRVIFIISEKTTPTIKPIII